MTRRRRLGARQAVPVHQVGRVDVRVVGATNEDLPALAHANRFRADLLDRLSFEVVTLPPLRARKEDIALLSNHFARRMAVELGWSGFPGFTPAARNGKTTSMIKRFNDGLLSKY